MFHHKLLYLTSPTPLAWVLQSSFQICPHLNIHNRKKKQWLEKELQENVQQYQMAITEKKSTKREKTTNQKHTNSDVQKTTVVMTENVKETKSRSKEFRLEFIVISSRYLSTMVFDFVLFEFHMTLVFSV